MLKNFVILGAFSTFVVAVIIGLNIFHNYQVSSLPPSTQTRINKITPNFDKATIDKLKRRTPISVNLNENSSVTSEDSQTPTTSTPTPTLTQNENQTSSSSATVTGLTEDTIQDDL